jgi:hypothetical protein
MKGFKMKESNMCMFEIQTDENKIALNKPDSSDNNFEKLLIEAVDEGLSFMGDSCKEAIYFYLKSTFKIEKQEISYKIEEFTNALEKIFGEGSKIIEIRIIRALHQRVNQFNYFPNQGDIVFAEYVVALRRFL